MPTYYNTAVVAAAAQALDRFTPFLRDTFFSSVVMFDTKEIIFDKIGRRRKIAPFVSPNVPAVERAQRTGTVSAYTPPYMKPLTTLLPAGAQVRRAGERYGGEQSMLNRFEAQIQEVLADHDNEISGQEERMCAQLLQTGTVVAVGEGIDDTISYGRDAALTEALTSTARWGESGVKPLDTIKASRRKIAEKSGANARTVVLGYGAAALFTADADVRDLLDNRRQASGQLAMGGNASGGAGDVAYYIGSIDGIDYWEYAQTYEDDGGNSQHFWPEYGVGLVSDQMLGHMAYGAIMDVKALRAEARFAKQDTIFDPSAEVIITESAPLPVPVEVNGSYFATVR